MGRDGLGLRLDPVYWSHDLHQGSAKGERQVKMHKSGFCQYWHHTSEYRDCLLLGHFGFIKSALADQKHLEGMDG